MLVSELSMHRAQPSHYPSAYPKPQSLSQDDVRQLQEYSRALTQKWDSTHYLLSSLLHSVSSLSYRLQGRHLDKVLFICLPWTCSCTSVVLPYPAAKLNCFFLSQSIIYFIKIIYGIFRRLVLKATSNPLSSFLHSFLPFLFNFFFPSFLPPFLPSFLPSFLFYVLFLPFFFP